MAAPVVVFGRPALSKCFLPPLLEFFRGAVAIICLPRFQQLVDIVPVYIEPGGLAERSLVPLESQPLDALYNGLYILISRAACVGILDPQNKCALAAPGEQPVKKSGPGAADVQMPCRTRRKSYLYWSVQ